MAKKEDDFSYGGFDFDKNLDINFDDDGPMEPPELSTRKVVQDLGKGLAKGTAKSLLDGNRWKESIRQQLPESFQVTWKTYDETVDGLGALYDHAEKEVSPVLGQIAKKIDTMIPEKHTRIKGVTKALSDKFYKAPSSSRSNESIQSEAASRLIEETFANLNELTGDAKKAEEQREIGREAVKEQIDKGRHDQSIKIFGRMDSNINRLTIYNERVNASFQKKSLEIGFRSYMVLGETLQTLKTNQNETTNLLKTIAHHTRLPETAKITMTERFKENMKRRSVDGLHNRMFGEDSAFGGAIKNFGADFKSAIEQFKSGLETGLMGVEAVGDVGEMLDATGETKMSAAGDFGGGFIGDWIRKKVLGKVMPDVLKNDKFQKFGYDAGKMALNPSNGLDAIEEAEFYKKWAEGQHGDKVTGVMDYAKSLFTRKRGTTDLDDTSKIKDVRSVLSPGDMTKRSMSMQTDAVPGYLARILKQITWLRTKKEPGLLSFDPLSGKFKTDSGMLETASNFLKKESASSNYGNNLDALTKTVKTEMGFKDEDEADLSKALSSFAFNHQGSLNGKSIRNSKAYTEGTERQKQLLEALAERIDTKDVNGSKTGYFLSKRMEEVRQSSSSMGGLIQALIDAGFKDQLLAMKLITISDSGEIRMDHDAIQKFNFDNLALHKEEEKKKSGLAGLAESIFKKKKTEETGDQAKVDTDGTTSASPDGTATSDINAKKSFKSFDPKSALYSVNNLPISSWNYKDKKKGEHRRVGPMAQDLYREFGDEAAPGGKKVDLVSMNGVALSAIQELTKNQEALKSAIDSGFNKKEESPQWKTVDYLKSIDEQIFELNENIQNKRFEMFIPGIDFTKIDLSGTLDSTKKFVDPLFKTGNKYFDLFQSALMTGASDAFDLGKKGLSKGKEKADEASDFIKETWANNKDGFKEKRKWFFDKVIDISGKAIDFGSNLVTQKIPSAVKSLANGLKNVRDGIKNILNGPVDVYITGNTSPVLLASRMRAGVYARSSDGKIIKTIDDLLAVKSDIIDISLNNEVALRWSDMANGLFDANGNKLKSLTKLTTTLVTGAVGYGIKKIGGAIKNLKDNVPSFQKAKDAFGGIKSMVSNKFQGMSGFGFGDSRMVAVLAQIRDLMAFGKPKKIVDHVFKRKLEDVKDLSGMSFLSVLFGKNFNKEDYENIKAAVTGKESEDKSKDFNENSNATKKTEGQASSGMFKKMMDTIKNPSTLKSIFTGEGTPGSDTFVGPVQPGKGKESLFQKMKGRLNKVPGAGKLKGLKDAFMSGAQAPDKDSKKGSFFSRMKDKFFKKSKQKPSSSELATVEDHYDDIYPIHQPRNNRQLGNGQQQLGYNGSNTKSSRYNAADVDDVEFRDVPPEVKKQSWYKKLLARNKNKVLDYTKSAKGGLPGMKGWASGKLAAGKGLMGKAAGKLPGIAGAIGKGLSWLGGGLSSLLGGATQRPEDDGPVGTSLATVHERASTVRGTGDGSKTGKATFNDREGDGERDGGATEQLRRIEDENKARKEANAVKMAEAAKTAQATSLRYVPQENAIDSILNSTKGLLSSLTDGVGSMFEMGKGLFNKLGGIKGIVKGFKGVGGKLLSGAKGLGNLAKGARMAGMVSKAVTAARVVGLVSGGGLGSIIGVGASVLSAVLSSPITIPALAIAAATYGAYRAYKYFTRNNLNEYEKIRALQYGFATESKDLHLLMELEGYFLDGRISYSNGVANFNSQNMKSEEILDIMGIEKEDAKGAQNLGAWLNNRFKPFFLNHLTVLFGVDPKRKLGDVGDLEPEKLQKYLEGAKFMDGPYDESTSPLKSQDSLSNTKSDVVKCLDAAIAALKDKIKKEKPKNMADAVISDLSKNKNVDVKENLDKAKAKENAEKAKAVLEAEKAINPPKTKMSDVLEKKPGEKVLDENLKGDDGGGGNGKASGVTPKDTSGTFASGGNATSLNAADGALFSDKEGAQFLQFHKGAKIDGVHPGLKKQLLSMAAEYGKVTGKSILVTDGSRTYDEQKILYDNYPEKAARPGTSLHEFGLAIDIDSKIADNLDKLGLMRKYGFTRPVGGEKWHTEPAGIQSNIAKAKKDPSFAAAAIEASIGRGGGGYGSQAGSTKRQRNPVLAKALFESDADNKVDPTKQTEAANDSKGGLPSPKVASNDAKVDDKSQKTSGSYVGIPSKTDKSTATADASGSTGESSRGSSPGTAGASMSSGPLATKTASASPGSSGELGGHTGSSPVTKTEVSNVAVNDAKGGSQPKGVEEVKSTIAKAATKAKQDPKLLQLFAAAESSMGQNMKPHVGSAQGPYQFMPTTWSGVIKQFGSKYGLGSDASPMDVTASTLMTSEYLKQNASYIKGARPNPDIVDYYLTHLLGPGGARTFVGLKDDETAAPKLQAAARNNKNIFYKNGKALTAGEIRQLLYDKFNNLSKQYGINMAITPGKIGGAANGSGGGSSSGGSGGSSEGASGSSQGNSSTAQGKPSFGESSSASKNSVVSPQESTKANPTAMETKETSRSQGAEPRNQVETRRGPDRSVQGMPDVASGMTTIMERSATANEQLLTTVQNDIVPILRGVQETLMKIYSEGKEIGGKKAEVPEAKSPEANQRRPLTTMASSVSTVDRARKYG